MTGELSFSLCRAASASAKARSERCREPPNRRIYPDPTQSWVSNRRIPQLCRCAKIGSQSCSIITMIKRLAATSSTMIQAAEEHYPYFLAHAALPKHELLEIHRTKISLHHAKAGYSYPTIRLPQTFLKRAGLPIRYQTFLEGALAFLVVVPPRKNASEGQETPWHTGKFAKVATAMIDYIRRRLYLNNFSRRDPVDPAGIAKKRNKG